VFVGNPTGISGQQGVVEVYTADGPSADIAASSEPRAAESGGGAGNLLQILLLATLAARGIFRSHAGAGGAA
jgi:hypothetical protein